MNRDDLNKPVTLEVLLEFTDEVLLPRISGLIDIKLDERLRNYPTKAEVAEIIDKKLEEKLEEKFEAFEKRLEQKFVTKAYLDDKLADLAVEIIDRIERRLEREKRFKTKVTDILRRNGLPVKMN